MLATLPSGRPVTQRALSVRRQPPLFLSEEITSFPARVFGPRSRFIQTFSMGRTVTALPSSSSSSPRFRFARAARASAVRGKEPTAVVGKSGRSRTAQTEAELIIAVTRILVALIQSADASMPTQRFGTRIVFTPLRAHASSRAR